MTYISPEYNYTESVKGCHHLLQDALEHSDDTQTAVNAEAIATKAERYATTLYIEQVGLLGAEDNHIGLSTYHAAIPKTLAEIDKREDDKSPARELFSSMRVIYTKPDCEAHVGNGPHALVRNMFLAAAFEWGNGTLPSHSRNFVMQ